MKQLEAACIKKVRERFVPELERIAEESLGKPKNGNRWMEFQVDDDTHSPVILFIIHLTKLLDSNIFVA